jgi:hypothetical protein
MRNAARRLDALDKTLGTTKECDQVQVIHWEADETIWSETLTREEYVERYGREPEPGISVDWGETNEYQ